MANKTVDFRAKLKLFGRQHRYLVDQETAYILPIRNNALVGTDFRQKRMLDWPLANADSAKRMQSYTPEVHGCDTGSGSDAQVPILWQEALDKFHQVGFACACGSRNESIVATEHGKQRLSLIVRKDIFLRE